MLNGLFPNRWIGIGSPVVEWPPRSPDLSTCDSYLWGTIKDRVFGQGLPDNVEDLRQRIEVAFRAVTPEEVQRVHQSTLQRIGLCEMENGGHFEHLLVRHHN